MYLTKFFLGLWFALTAALLTAAEPPAVIEFDAHVQSVLTRAGCNSGACHGALAGKGGFKLSLRAYDSLSDHFNITRQDRGRRIDAANPARSLLLAKPTGMIAHKGGVRLDPNSDDYRILADWIAAGAPGPQPDDPKLVRIEMQPEQLELARDARQQMTVRAHYSNGRIDDVTRWAKFNSANEAMAGVDANGQVNIVGYGKGSIVATLPVALPSRPSYRPILTKYLHRPTQSFIRPTSSIKFCWKSGNVCTWYHRLVAAMKPSCVARISIRREDCQRPNRCAVSWATTASIADNVWWKSCSPAKRLWTTGATNGRTCC